MPNDNRLTQRQALWCWVSFADLTNDAAKLGSAMQRLAQGAEHIGAAELAEPLEITTDLVAGVLGLYLEGVIDADDLENWAQVLELRADIDAAALEGLVYALANPEQMGGITPDTVQRLLSLLTT